MLNFPSKSRLPSLAIERTCSKVQHDVQRIRESTPLTTLVIDHNCGLKQEVRSVKQDGWDLSTIKVMQITVEARRLVGVLRRRWPYLLTALPALQSMNVDIADAGRSRSGHDCARVWRIRQNEWRQEQSFIQDISRTGAWFVYEFEIHLKTKVLAQWLQKTQRECVIKIRGLRREGRDLTGPYTTSGQGRILESETVYQVRMPSDEYSRLTRTRSILLS